MFQFFQILRFVSFFIILINLSVLVSCKRQVSESGLAAFTPEVSERYSLLLGDLEKNPRCFPESENPYDLFSPEEIAQEKVDYDVFEFILLSAPQVPCSSIETSKIDSDDFLVSAKTLLNDSVPVASLSFAVVNYEQLKRIKVLWVGATKGVLKVRGLRSGKKFSTFIGVSSKRNLENIALSARLKKSFKTTIPMKKKYIGENLPGYTGKQNWLVKYLSPSEREAYRLVLRDGKFYNSKGELFSTVYPHVSIHADGKAIFVVDRNGGIFASTYHPKGSFHHSSLLAGGDGYVMGELRTVEGQLTYINLESGHYTPPTEAGEAFLLALEKLRVDISKVVREFRPNVLRH